MDLTVRCQTVWKFDVDTVNTIIIGRTDLDTGDSPQIDLTCGLELGVSRRHTAVVRRGESWFAIDLHSANGTYVNGIRLLANRPRRLQHGDEIRIGMAKMRIFFRSGTNLTGLH